MKTSNQRPVRRILRHLALAEPCNGVRMLTAPLCRPRCSLLSTLLLLGLAACGGDEATHYLLLVSP